VGKGRRGPGSQEYGGRESSILAKVDRPEPARWSKRVADEASNFPALHSRGADLGNVDITRRNIQSVPSSEPFHRPRTWDDAAISKLEVPLANPIGSPKHITAEYYYKIPVRPIYKQYPVYAPGREPAGYMDWSNSRNQ
jgi:hypothetical protein